MKRMHVEILLLLLCLNSFVQKNKSFASCTIIRPTQQYLVENNRHLLRSSPLSAPTPTSTSARLSLIPRIAYLKKRDEEEGRSNNITDTQIDEEENDLDLYQFWASKCRNRDQATADSNNRLIATSSSINQEPLQPTPTIEDVAASPVVNNLWRTVTQTVNCGGGHAVTVTRTVTAQATATSTKRKNKNSESKSCSGQCWSDYLWHTYGDSISPAQGFTGIVCIIIGLYLSILGFRFFRPTLALTGFVFFATMTWIGLVNNEPAGGYPLGDVIYICVSAGLGLLGAVFMVFLYPLGVYCLACLGGFYFAVYFLSWKSDLIITLKVARVCFIIGISLLGPIVLYFVETYMVLFATALMGAYLFYFGLDLFAHTGFINPWMLIFDGNPHHKNVYLMSKSVYTMLAFVIINTMISIGWQYYYNIICLKAGFGLNPKVEKPPEETKKSEEAAPPPAYMCVPTPPPPYCAPPQPMFMQNIAAGAMPYHYQHQ